MLKSHRTQIRTLWPGVEARDLTPIGDAADFAWLMCAYPEIGHRVVRAFGGELNDSFMKRCRFLYLLMPFHEVIYGLDSDQPEFVQSGIDGIVSRLDGIW